MKNIWLQKRQERLVETVFRIPESIPVPQVNAVFPPLLASKLMGVQPLSGPTGLVYYLRFKYGRNIEKPKSQ